MNRLFNNNNNNDYLSSVNTNNINKKRFVESLGIAGYSMSSYKVVMTIIILGYFAVKLLNKTVNDQNKYDTDTTCYPITQYDFMGLLIFGTFIYVFNGYLGDLKLTKSIFFALFYIIGLMFGYFYHQAKLTVRKSGDTMLLNIMSSLYYFVTIIVIMFSIYVSTSSPSSTIAYIVYLVTFVGIAYYLNTFNKKYRDPSNQDIIYVFTNKFVLTIPMVSFLINLLFLKNKNETSTASTILKTFSGLFLGIFVSSIAVFGIRSLIPDENVVTCNKDNLKCKVKVLHDNSLTDAFKSSKLANTTLIVLLTLLLLNGILLGKSFIV